MRQARPDGRWPGVTWASWRRCATGLASTFRSSRRTSTTRFPAARGRGVPRRRHHGRPVHPVRRIGRAACAETGTDYVDLTGEPEFVDRVYVRHHATAERTGARLVHACGFDSIPRDLGALFTVQQLPDDLPIRMRGCVSARGLPSGGTLESALTIFSRFRQAAAGPASPFGGRFVRTGADSRAVWSVWYRTAC
jgi:hypothetical protein